MKTAVTKRAAKASRKAGANDSPNISRMTGVGTRKKSDKALQPPKRDALATLEPLEHKPTPKEDIDLVPLSKVRLPWG